MAPPPSSSSPTAASGSSGASTAALELGALRRMDADELCTFAERLGVDDARELRRQDVILAVLEAHADRRGETHAEGVLEVLPDGFGFLRSPEHTFQPGADDVYVSPSQIRRFGLRTGDTVRGTVRAPKETERYFALLRVESVEGGAPDQHPHRIDFDDRDARPAERSFSLTGAPPWLRLADLYAPLGFGQRILVRAPPRSGKSALLGALTRTLIANHPEAHVTLVAIDVRPEDQADLARGLAGHVALSTLADPPARHVQLVEMLVERGKRLAERGGDAVVVIDSLGRLARAQNVVTPPTGRTLVGALDAAAAVRLRRTWASARRLADGGSLTIIGTLTTDSGQRIDEVLADDLAETAAVELVLERTMADDAPTLDRTASFSRQADRLVADRATWRRALGHDRDAALAACTDAATDRAALIAALNGPP